MSSEEEGSRPVTPAKRLAARQQGYVPRSGDVVVGLLLVISLAWWASQAPSLGLWLQSHFVESWRAELVKGRTGDQLLHSLQQGFYGVALQVAPYIALLIATVALAHWVQHGPLWLPHRLVPDFHRIDPMTNWQRLGSLLSPRAWLWPALKGAAILGVGGVWAAHLGPRAFRPSRLAPSEWGEALGETVLQGLGVVAVAWSVIGLIDFAWRWWVYEQSLQRSPDDDHETVRGIRTDLQSPRRRFPATQSVDSSE